MRGPASRRPAPCPRQAGCPTPDRGSVPDFRGPKRVSRIGIRRESSPDGHRDTPERMPPAAFAWGSARGDAEPAGVHDAARALVEPAAGWVDEGPTRRRGGCPRTLGRHITCAAIPAGCLAPIRQAGLSPRRSGHGYVPSHRAPFLAHHPPTRESGSANLSPHRHSLPLALTQRVR